MSSCDGCIDLLDPDNAGLDLDVPIDTLILLSLTSMRTTKGSQLQSALLFQGQTYGHLPHSWV